MKTLKNNLRTFVFLLAVLIFLSPTKGQQNDTLLYFTRIISELTADSLGGRLAGTDDEKKAAQIIADEFKNLRLKKFIRSYFQFFEFSTDSLHKFQSCNVIAYVNNRAEKNIIIAAHYDHIGMGGKYSRSIAKTAVHPGADDNASGVALMLGLAKYLRKGINRNYNFVFVATGAHELGLYGSENFIGRNIPDVQKIALMINLDMVGRLDENLKSFYVEKSGNQILDSLVLHTDAEGLHIKIKESSQGDHTVFREKGILTLRFTTGMHDDYHTINDKADKINYTGMLKELRYLLKLISSLNL